MLKRILSQPSLNSSPLHSSVKKNPSYSNLQKSKSESNLQIKSGDTSYASVILDNDKQIKFNDDQSDCCVSSNNSSTTNLLYCDFQQRKMQLIIEKLLKRHLVGVATIIQDFQFASELVNSQDMIKSLLMTILMMSTIKDNNIKIRRLKFILGVFCSMHYINDVSLCSIMIK